jgi:hypothetical protein
VSAGPAAGGAVGPRQRLGPCAVAGRGGDALPTFFFLFFYFKTDFLQFNSCSKTKQNKRKQINKIKQKLCCSMNAISNTFLPYILFYLIL